MDKTLLLRKTGSQFVEIIATQGKHPAKRSYGSWEKTSARLSLFGLPPEEIDGLKAEFESGKDLKLIQIP